MAKHINFINRYRLKGYNSIEELFNSIFLHLSKTESVIWTTLPNYGASINSLLKNLASIPKQRNTIYHITGDVNYIAIKFGKQSILTIHDVQSALSGSFLKKFIISWLWFKIPARKAKFITVISKFTKSELIEVIPRHQHKIKVIYNPVNPNIKPDNNKVFNAENPKILCVGTKGNKNLKRIISAVNGLNIELIILGVLTPIQTDFLKINNIQYNSFNQLAFDEVIELYRNCDMVCFPSLYEGFGMPIIEAQAVGRPVLTSNYGAMKEVAGNAACLVNPLDEKEIREGILKIVGNQSYRENLVKQGFLNISRFDIDKISQEYLNLYNQIL
ncbi:MAG: glycosyltransferase family 1 protein [Bacteroidota bacterium]